MAGRTLGEAWVTIRPETAAFRAELTSKVNSALKGYKPTVRVSVDIGADTASLRTKLKTAVTAASKGLSVTSDVKAKLDEASVAKTKTAIDAATKNRVTKVKTESDAEKAAAAYAAWWAKALNQRTLRERAAMTKAQSAEEAAAAKTSRDYVNWWNKALDQQALKSRQVSSGMQKDLDGLSVKIDKYRDRLTGMIISTNDSQAEHELDLLDSKANVLAQRLGSIKTNVGLASALSQMAALDLAAAKFHATMSAKNSMPDLGLELTLAQSQFLHLEQNAKNLKKEIESALTPGSITLKTVTEEARKDLLGLAGGANGVLREIQQIRSHGGPVTADDIAKVKILTSGLGQLTAAVAADGVTVKSATGSYRGWVNTLLAIARAQIPLFNGALEKMLPHFLAVASGTHILVEAALEVIAVWVPAAAALTVFAAAAAKASYEVYHDVRNMGVAASGTGQQFEGMSKKIGTSMSNIAKPYVFQAYGLALIGLQKQSQTTAGVIQVVGNTIDRWIAEAVLAYQKGTGQLAKKGATDLAILGDSFKQVGTIINGFIKITPGYAKDLLMLGDSILHVASAILNSGWAQGFGKIFLALHGAIFYLGLFATLGTKLGTALLSPLMRITGLSRALGALGVTSDGTKGKLGNLMTSIAEGWQAGTGKAIKAVDEMGFPLQTAMANNVEKATKSAEGKFGNLKTVASEAMTGLGSKVGTAAKGIKGALTGMLSGLGINPWLLGIAAIGVAMYAIISIMGKGANAAKEFGSAAQTALSNSSIQDFGTNMQIQMKTAEGGLTSAKMAAQKFAQQVAGAKPGTVAYAESLNEMGRASDGVKAAIGSSQAKVQSWQNVVNGLNAQNQKFNSNLSLISKTAGVDLPTAMNLANQAGITTKQMMNDTGVAAQEDALQVEGLVKGYASLVNGIGGVNVAYQALNVQNSSTMKNAQSVASAFANYTTLLTGGANAFDTFVQGQTTLTTSMNKLPGASTTATLTLGKLKDKISLVGASLDGLSPAAVAANQAFLQQINNAQALYGQLIQLAAASGNTAVAQNNLHQAGKDMISTLLKTAGGSKAAQQQVYSLAQTFGYTGKNTLPAMVKWLGATGDKTSDLKDRMNGLTAGAGNLLNASKALSSEMNNQLGQAMSKSIIDAEGGQAAFDKFASAIRKFAGHTSDANMKAVMKQGAALKQVFISSAGSAAAAEPVLQNYFMTLGIKNQKQAKQMANAILGIGKAATAITKPIHLNRGAFVEWGRIVGISDNAAGALWDKLAKNNFNPLSGNVDKNKKKFMDWAAQMHISKSKAGDLWAQLLNNHLETVNSKVDGNKKKFIDLMVKMGETKDAAKHLWDTLQKAPHVKASVNVAASTSGQIAAVASAPGAAKQTIGRLFFSAQAHGMATGGKVPGFWNTGDNVPAMSPNGPLMLQGGEAIVPKHLATNPKFTSFAKDHGIPGFASGGLVGTSNLVNMADNFPNFKASVANAGIDHAGEAMKANSNAAYNALVNAYGGAGGSASGRSILMDAEKYKGHRYVWGGPSNPSQGWDCSSFAGYVLGHDMHMKLPGGAAWNAGAHGPVASQFTKTPGFHMVSHNPKDIQAGDLLVEGSGGHVGFGVGPNRMFSAYGTAFGTIFSDAANMTNILRMGGTGGGAALKGLTTKIPLVNAMAKDIGQVYSQSSAIQSLFPALGGAYSGNPTGANPNYRASAGVAQWGGDVLKALSMLHLPSTLENQILYQISTESGGNPNSINKVDSNAKSGDPSRGLLQTTGATFKAFHVPGTSSNIYDGLANIAAATNYAEHRYGPSLMSGGNGLGSGHGYAMGGLIPGFAAGGKIKSNPAQAQLTKLHHQHDRYAADYHRHIAAAKHDKSKSAKAYQMAQAAMYAKKISQIDTEIAYDKSVKLKLPKPTNDDMRLAEKLSAPPWSTRLTSGSYSTSPLGWGMQPVLGDLMIADHFKPQSWVGKANIDPQAASVMANWVAAMGVVGGFLGSNPNVAKLAGKATGVHGKTTGGKSFKLGGTVGEDVVGGFGISSGAPYTFHAGDRMVGPNQTPGQINQNGLSQEDRQILLGLLAEAKRSNQIAAQQPREYAKALNSNVARKVGR